MVHSPQTNQSHARVEAAHSGVSCLEGNQDMTTLPSDETYEPSAPNHIWPVLSLLLAVILGASAFQMFDNEYWSPLPQVFVALALVIGPRNLQGLLLPPYLRLSHQGMTLRVWRYYWSENDTVNWSALFAKIFLPFHRYTTVEIPWDQLTAIKPFKHTINGLTVEHSMTIGYQTPDGTSQAIVFSGDLFSVTPLNLSIAIQEYQDREFRWKPLRESGALEAWASRQQQNFHQPLTIRYRPNQLWLGVGLAGLSVMGATIVSVKLSHSVWTSPISWLCSIATTAAILGFIENLDWLTLGKRRTVVLSSDGLRLGQLDSPSTEYLWGDIVSARLRQVNYSGINNGLYTNGLDVSFADGRRLFLPNGYDYSLVELERILTPNGC